jgi:hypothetical protein
MEQSWGRRRFFRRRIWRGANDEEQVTEMDIASREQNDDSSGKSGSLSSQNANEPSATTSYELEKK